MIIGASSLGGARLQRPGGGAVLTIVRLTPRILGGAL